MRPRPRLLAAGLALLLAACASRPPAEVFTPPGDLRPVTRLPGQPLRAVATTSLVADIVGRVGGDRLALTALFPAGVDPHAFEPTPGDLESLAAAQVVFANGLGLELFLPPFVRGGAVGGPVVSLSHGIEPLLSDGEADPHVWFDPRLVQTWVDNAEAALSALDPEGAEAYATRAEAARQELAALDAWIRDQLAQVPPERRRLVTDHQVLAYFARRYGVEVVGTVLPSAASGGEPPPQHLVALEQAIHEQEVRVLVVTEAANRDLVRRVAADTGAQVVEILAAGLTGPQGPAPDYAAFMQYNVRALVEAMMGAGQ